MYTTRRRAVTTLLTAASVLTLGCAEHTTSPFPIDRSLSNQSQSFVTGFTGQGTWSTKAPTPTTRSFFASAAVDGIVYTVGGYNSSGGFSLPGSNEAYDPATNTWSTKAPIPTPRYGLAGAAARGILYVAGGNNGGTILNTMEAYDPSTNTWTTKAPMPTARQGVALIEVGGILYAIGGDNYAFLNTVEAYDPTTNSWSTKAPMPTARTSVAVVAVYGIVYAVGGYDGVTVPYPGATIVATVQAYNTATNTWSTKAPMPTARYAPAAAAVDGIVYVVGGFNGGVSLTTVDAYDPTSNAWSGKAAIPTGRGGLAVVEVGGILYAIGGSTGMEVATVSATNEAFSLGDLTPPTVSCAAADGAWHKSDVTIACTASDPESGLANAADASFALTTSVPSGNETENAATNSRQVCNAVGACTTAGPISGNRVDKKPPTVSFGTPTPAPNAAGWNNTNVSIPFTVAENGSGVATVNPASPLLVTVEGATATGTVTVTDNAGNTATLTSPAVKIDKTPPVLTVPASVTVDATNPAGAVVTYSALAADNLTASPTVQCTPVSGGTFAIGTTTVSCNATDLAGNMSSKSFPILVQAAAAQIANLRQTVQSFNLQAGITNSLDAKLANVEAALTGARGGNLAATCNMLDAFINQTQAQSGKQIAVDQANQLMAAANRIKAVIGCR